MHSTYWYLLDLPQDAPREGPELLTACTDRWLSEYQRILDENNWFQELYCAERGGASVAHPELSGQTGDFDEAEHRALLSLISELSMYGRLSEGDFLDVNPMSFGPRGQDESLLNNMDTTALRDLVLDRGARYLQKCYAQLALDPSANIGLESYQRSCFARRYELFLSSPCRPFSDELPSPYDYPCADLRSGSKGREAILAVDIHT